MSSRIDLEHFPVSETALKMLSYVSDGFYETSYVGKWLYEAMGEEYDSVAEATEDLRNQLFVETATWGLKYHEIKWGLPVRENLTYEQRRFIICEKRDHHSPMTPWMMETYLNNAVGCEADVRDVMDPGGRGAVTHPNIFTAYINANHSANYEDGIHTLLRLKQSHTMLQAKVHVQPEEPPTLYAGSVLSIGPGLTIKALLPDGMSNSAVTYIGATGVTLGVVITVYSGK